VPTQRRITIMNVNGATPSDPIRIFVGCDPNDCDLEQMMVLDHSLHQHASEPLEIHWMRLSGDPASPWYSEPAQGRGWRTERWATPFSGFRWAVPAVCDFTGRAIYMDADVMALGDIAELWRAPLAEPAVVMGKGSGKDVRFCVSLWDNSRARTHVGTLEALQGDPASHAGRSRYFASHPELVAQIDPTFNNIDGEGLPADRIRMLHYSDMGTQFSHGRAMARLAREGQTHWFDGPLLTHPRRDLSVLFDDCYEDALRSGRTLDDYRNPHPYGPVVKKSERRHKGNPVTRPGLLGKVRRVLGMGGV
jgi:hypothetical protein